MIYEIFAWLGALVVNAIGSLGYSAIFILMALESACIPIPSEIIMPFSGFLVWSGRFNFMAVVLWGTFGNLAGSILAYAIGLKGGRPLIEKYGKYILITHDDLDRADAWFKKYGAASVFFSRMLPVVRTFISLPAGIARMPFWKFSFYTFFGSLPWVFVLAYTGILMGESWKDLEKYFRKFDWAILLIAVLVAGWWLYKKLKAKNTPAAES